jgi:uncharacterized protein (DUF1501 family)
MGSDINGGRVLGKQVKLTQAALFQNRDYPILTSYRSMLAGLFDRLYGLESASLQKVLPNVRPAHLGIL